MTSTPASIPPADVVSPKRHWSLIAVLRDANDDGSSLAIGRWNGKPVLAMRWNGDEQNPIGNPQSRGLPTWFIVPDAYNEAVLGTLTKDKRMLVRNFIAKSNSHKSE
jgi:hypothetical protein